MQLQTIYFLFCVFVAAGGYLACFYFAKKDWSGYAIFSFLIASSAAGAAAKVVYDNPQAQTQQQVPPSTKP